ncbi:MAG: Cell division protein ZapD [Accumulibacter sp.]|uniref:cell division protein ZapD n=1 Tax=Accumulibacter sp. TaxID=2053492 RepID=UPI0012101443|nr:cell division protein ZapD [Accumulibacter sp.]QKS28578.1 MAG: cell division protein ZapD [Candidatus Accumulibacter similis]TLD44694.1 MAG: Cell division protein ZapD [Accumulibacter sp.]
MITYEYPFNERIRTLLRLEDLFHKLSSFMQRDGSQEHHVVLLTLFEILDVAGRADLKMDLIQELERQRQSLLAFRNNPDISEDALSGALYEIENASAALLGMAGKIGQHLRDNDWLMSIKSRASIPGGVCEFDLPSYHYWRHQPPDVRRDALLAWLQPLLPLRDALTIVLRLLRASGRSEHHVASGGAFQLMLGGSNAQSTSQMVRISLKLHDPYIPEISANKYALNIRFTRPDSDHRPRHCDTDVEFDMLFCNL